MYDVRSPSFLAVGALTVLTAVLAACGGDPADPFDPGPAVPNIGALVHPTPEIFAGASMAWAEPDERIAFRSWDGEQTHIKSLDLGTGEIRIVDGPASLFGGPAVARQLAVREDGEELYYVIFADDESVLALRSARLDGGTPTTLDPTGGYAGLALAPDGTRLVHARAGALGQLDLATGEWTEIPMVEGSSPAAFSPDGSELLVLDDAGPRRVPLADGASEPLDLPTGFEVVAARWDASGIRILAAQEEGAVAEFDFASGTGMPLESDLGSPGGVVRGGTLASEGDGFALWTERCIAPGAFGGCGTQRITVLAGRSSAEGPTALGSWDVSDSTRPATAALLFSPDGSRLYYSLDGVLYVVDVP